MLHLSSFVSCQHIEKDTITIVVFAAVLSEWHSSHYILYGYGLLQRPADSVQMWHAKHHSGCAESSTWLAGSRSVC